MKTIFTIWLFLAISFKCVGGCNDGHVNWRIINKPMNEIDITYFGSVKLVANQNDTIQIRFEGKGPCGVWSYRSSEKNDIPFNPIVYVVDQKMLIIKFSSMDGEYNIKVYTSYSCVERSFHFSIHPLNIVGISEINSHNNFLNVSPNPASKQITITNSSQQILEINLLNSLGAIVLSASPNYNQTNFNVEELPRGVYYLTAILEDKKRLTKKIIIE